MCTIMSSFIKSVMMMMKITNLPGVFPRLADDKALSVGVSPPLGQNSEQTFAAGTRSNKYTVKLEKGNAISQRHD